MNLANILTHASLSLFPHKSAESLQLEKNSHELDCFIRFFFFFYVQLGVRSLWFDYKPLL